ncbi:MAG: hypothetical protein M0P38_05605 [Bacteroidales bacterium]|nr:hypothetical protein [Bacteroidales bacterium]
MHSQLAERSRSEQRSITPLISTPLNERHSIPSSLSVAEASNIPFPAR